MDSKTQSILTELRRRLEAIYGDRLVRLVLYGSRARGDADPESDYDVLVALRAPVSPSEEIEKTINDVTEISLNNNISVACVFISEGSYIREQSPLMINVRREGIKI